MVIALFTARRPTVVTAQILHTTRELHSRVSDGIHVRMLWNEHDGRVTVAVADSKDRRRVRDRGS